MTTLVIHTKGKTHEAMCQGISHQPKDGLMLFYQVLRFEMQFRQRIEVLP
jgi:hypothetical protein